MSGEEWDHKHGLQGFKRGTNYIAPSGAELDSGSLSVKQVRGRIFELFGQTSQTQEARMMGLPSHVAQLQGVLKNLMKGVGEKAIKSAEKDLRSDIGSALRLAACNVPPIGLVFPGSGIVSIFWSYGGLPSVTERYVGEIGLADAYAHWELSEKTIGPFRTNYGVYKAWVYYQNIAPPTVTAANERKTAVQNFFADGLQWDSWSVD